MSAESIACPLCGHRFEPQRHAGCPACPLGAGCGTVCCPACGYSTVDPSRSGLVRLARLLLGKTPSGESKTVTLAQATPGSVVGIAGFSEDLSFRQREHLQAYGLVDGRTVRVLQHSPATVVQVEHLELALEAELAGKVIIAQGPAAERSSGKLRETTAGSTAS